MRFLGTSSYSTTILNVFKSILSQLKLIFNLDIDNLDRFENAIDIQPYLLKILNLLQKDKPNEKIIIVLDGLDQLVSNDHQLNWINFKRLPENTKLIISMASNYHGLLDKLVYKLGVSFDNLNFLELKCFDLLKSSEFLKLMLDQSKRCLTSLQWDAIEICLKNTETINTLHLKLLYTIVVKWASSYTPDVEFKSCTSVKHTINYLFKSSERIHGSVFFQRCIFYLTIFNDGITENELEDILSIDDDVLTSLYQHYEPPIRRFPLAFWIHLRYFLKDYLIERNSDNLTLLTW